MVDRDSKTATGTKAPAPAPGTVIKPSPFQPPAEIDPPYKDPGDQPPK